MKTFRLALVVLASVLFCVGNAVGQEATESDAAAKPQRIPQQSQHDLVQSGAKQYESSIAAGQTSENCKPLNISGFCDLARPDARPCNAGGGTRTHTGFNSQRILNPSRLPISPHRPHFEPGPQWLKQLELTGIEFASSRSSMDLPGLTSLGQLTWQRPPQVSIPRGPN